MTSIDSMVVLHQARYAGRQRPDRQPLRGGDVQLASADTGTAAQAGLAAEGGSSR
jgi:hypothetical protein